MSQGAVGEGTHRDFAVVAYLFQPREQGFPFLEMRNELVILYDDVVEFPVFDGIGQAVFFPHRSKALALHLQERPVLREAVKTNDFGVARYAERVQKHIGILIINVTDVAQVVVIPPFGLHFCSVEHHYSANNAYKRTYHPVGIEVLRQHIEQQCNDDESGKEKGVDEIIIVMGHLLHHCHAEQQATENFNQGEPPKRKRFSRRRNDRFLPC